MVIGSLGQVVNILAIFSNAYILKNKRIKICHIKGIGCPLFISINILTKERKNKKEKIDQTGTQARLLVDLLSRLFNLYIYLLKNMAAKALYPVSR